MQLSYLKLDDAGKGTFDVALAALEPKSKPASSSNCLARPCMTGLVFHGSPAQCHVSLMTFSSLFCRSSKLLNLKHPQLYQLQHLPVSDVLQENSFQSFRPPAKQAPSCGIPLCRWVLNPVGFQPDISPPITTYALGIDAVATASAICKFPFFMGQLSGRASEVKQHDRALMKTMPGYWVPENVHRWGM